MTAHFPGLVQAWYRLSNDTPNTQMHDHLLPWLGNDTPNTQIHDDTLSWLGTGTTIKCGWIKVFFFKSQEPLNHIKRNLIGIFLRLPTTKYTLIVPIGNQRLPPAQF